MSGPYTADRLHGRRVVLDRLDRDGAALAVLLTERGAEVVLADPTPSEPTPPGCRLVPDPRVAVERAELLLVDCWTGETAPHVARAHERGIPIGSLADLVLHEAPCPVVGVTGSAGKTMTARLIAHLCEAAGLDIHVPPTGRAENAWPSAETLELLAAGDVPDLLVLELTSTHLAYVTTSPAHAVVTALWPDHVELHGGEGRYIAAKQRILSRQPDGATAVLPAGETRIAGKPGVRTTRFAGAGAVAGGVGVLDGILEDATRDASVVLADLERLPIAPYLWGNVAAAVACVRSSLLLDVAVDEVLEAHAQPAWRGEEIGRVGGTAILHNGMAATPAKAAAFMRGAGDRSLTVIIGGLDSSTAGPVHSSAAEERMLRDACAETARVAERAVLVGPAAARVAPLLAAAGLERVAVGPDLHWAVGEAMRDAGRAQAIAWVPMFPVELADREACAGRGAGAARAVGCDLEIVPG
ncbi:MAG: Mur ligase family protein [Gaiellales bacterium]